MLVGAVGVVAAGAVGAAAGLLKAQTEGANPMQLLEDQAILTNEEPSAESGYTS